MENLVVENLQAAFREGGQQAGSATMEAGLLQYAVRVPIALFNGIIPATSYSECSEQQIEAALHHFEAEHLPCCAWVLPQDKQYRTFFDQRGLISAGNYAGVIADLDELPTLTVPSRISVREVTSTKDYDLWVQVCCECLGAPQIAGQFGLAMQRYGEAGPARHLLGELDGDPVGVLTLFRSENTVGLWNGAVDPTVRRQGVATAMGLRALELAKAEGYQHVVAVLMAGRMAAGVCDKLGFRTCCELFPYIRGNDPAELEPSCSRGL